MSWSYLRRLERDVVAEPLRLLVGVGVAADAEQQRRVVDGRARVLVQPEPLGETQRDQALPSTCSMGCPKPRSIPSESAPTSSASLTEGRTAVAVKAPGDGRSRRGA